MPQEVFFGGESYFFRNSFAPRPAHEKLVFKFVRKTIAFIYSENSFPRNMFFKNVETAHSNTN